MSKKQMNKEAGFMGLEGMGALLFYLVMLAGAALLVVQLFSGGKLSEMEKSLSALRMNIQQLYTTQGTYTDLDNQIVVEAGILPAGFKHSADKTKITSPWNTDVEVTTEDGTDFTITVSDVPADDCVKFAMYDIDAWDSIKIGTTVIVGAAGDGETAGSAATVEAANTACTAAGGPAKFVFTAN